MKTFYGGAYFLDGAGKWRYTHNQQLVPGAEVFVDAAGNVGMNAPELLVHQVRGVDFISEWAQIKRPSVRRMIGTYIPLPQIVVDGTPLWSVPILEHWKSQRPGRGAHLRGRGKAA